VGNALQGLIRLAVTLGIIGVVGSMVAKEFFVDVVVITHNGMAPTIVAGDEIAVWRGANVDMANVVVCEHPSRKGELVIGRALVFAGHTIHRDYNGVIYVDEDRTATEPREIMWFYDVTRKKQFEMTYGHMSYGRHHEHGYFIERGTTIDLRTYRVSRGVYLLGDNRSDSGHDSRAFGEVDPAKCLGQAFLRLKSAPSNNDDLHRAPIGIID
jgi:signal peptidase I